MLILLSNLLLLLLLPPLLLTTLTLNNHLNEATTLDPRATTAEIIRARGYLATNIKFTTTDGYIINLVRANNPLINYGEPGGLANKSVVLLIHGMIMNSRSFVLNSQGVKPKNHAYLSAAELTDWQLGQLMSKDPASKSIAFALLNFGHEVWIMDRRGTFDSQGHVDPHRQAFKKPPRWRLGKSLLELGESLGLAGGGGGGDGINSVLKKNLLHLEEVANEKYWNWSMDEQAKFDLPEIVDFILKRSGCRQKMVLVGHSAGGTIILMALIQNPKLASKILRALLWAPAWGLGHDVTGVALMAPLLEDPLAKLTGPAMPSLASLLVQQGGGSLCPQEKGPLFELICSRIMVSMMGGVAGDQQDMGPHFFASIPDVISTHEGAQLAQSVMNKALHYFDFKSPEKNLIAYGQPQAPPYDLSKLVQVNGLSLWYGNTDHLTTIADHQAALEQLRVPVEVHSINQPNLFFNHFSFLIHRNISRHLILPSLADIERADGRPESRPTCSLQFEAELDGGEGNDINIQAGGLN